MQQKSLALSLCLAVLLSLRLGPLYAIEGDVADVRSTATKTDHRVLTPSEEQALLRLAEMYYKGETVDQNVGKAFELYRRLAEAGSRVATLQMGEMLARGQGVTRDFDRGQALIREVAETGYAKAYYILGDLYSDGEANAMDPKTAIAMYEKSVLLGDQWAMVRLGDIYHFGRFAQPDLSKAAHYYKMAANAGNFYGVHALGGLLVEGKVRGYGTSREGLELLVKADKAGIPEAISTIADCHFYGYGVTANSGAALKVLERAMKEGNIRAALRLIALYRDGKVDGRRQYVGRSTKNARQLLNSIADRLTASELSYQTFLLELSRAGPGRFSEFYEQLRKMPDGQQRHIIRDVHRVNENFYVYASQRRLKELNAFSGNSTGLFDSSTSRALTRQCRSTGTKYFCIAGPMSGNTAELISHVFRTHG